jgi:hypothetical protein
MLQACRSDVDLIRPTFGFVGKRRSARAAESPKRSGVSLVSMRLVALPLKVGRLHDGPGHGLGAGCAAAIFAMTIRGHTRFAFDLESNFSAVTSAGDHRLLHDIEPAEDRAKDRMRDIAAKIISTSMDRLRAARAIHR